MDRTIEKTHPASINASRVIGVYRPPTGVWYLSESTGGLALGFGSNGDVPVASGYLAQ